MRRVTRLISRPLAAPTASPNPNPNPNRNPTHVDKHTERLLLCVLAGMVPSLANVIRPIQIRIVCSPIVYLAAGTHARLS